jgi:hypothetical protein
MPEIVSCSAGCKRETEIPDDGRNPDGWERLQITGRWRCMECTRQLRAANEVEGAPYVAGVDTLPPASIGALKKLADAPPLHEKVKP